MARKADPLFDDGPDRPQPGAGEAKRPGRLQRLFRRPFRGGAGAARQQDRPAAPPRRLRWRIARWAFWGLLAIVLLYYPVGMALMHRIGDDTEMTAPAEKGASRAIAMAAALIRRETVDHAWTPNDPFIYPSWALDNLPNFQVGIRDALGRFAIEMADKIGRTRGSSVVDKDLEDAMGKLRYSPYTWVWDISVSLLPTSSTEAQYRAAMRSLLRYNTRLAAGAATFERRADNLQTLIDRVNADIGSDSARIAERVERFGGIVFDTRSDDLFYRTKGRVYGYYMILRELGADFAGILAEKQAQTVWANMMASLRRAAELQPLIVRNGAPDGMLQPNHLAAQGFFLLRARTQLKEVSDILQR
ncbi:MAG: DUF2333 family protein [Rhodospirillaceae bacterium]|nr:DUF2333 family protein [Rhodospirillaceae bacterium]